MKVVVIPEVFLACGRRRRNKQTRVARPPMVVQLTASYGDTVRVQNELIYENLRQEFAHE